MGPAELAELLQLNAIRIVLLVLVAAVVPVLALRALKRDTHAHSRHLQTVEIPLEFNTFQMGCQAPIRSGFDPNQPLFRPIFRKKGGAIPLAATRLIVCQELA
jgi:hypothetical protein